MLAIELDVDVQPTNEGHFNPERGLEPRIVSTQHRISAEKNESQVPKRGYRKSLTYYSTDQQLQPFNTTLRRPKHHLAFTVFIGYLSKNNRSIPITPSL
jgi:hypothetical protein